MSKEIVTVENLPLIVWKDSSVITTELLAAVYGANEEQVRQNFKRNADRFAEGKHYFRITGSDLKEFNLCVTNSHLQISSKTRSLMLWTERGTVRHAKMLGTDKAWDVQEALEEFYFSRRVVEDTRDLSLIQPAEEFKAVYAVAKLLFPGNQATLSANKAVQRLTGIDMLDYMGATHLIADQQDVLLTVTEIGQRLGLPTRQVNPMLEALGLQKGYRDHKNKQCWEITEEGLRYGVYQDTGKKHSDGTPVRQIRWNGALVSDLQKSITTPLVQTPQTH